MQLLFATRIRKQLARIPIKDKARILKKLQLLADSDLTFPPIVHLASPLCGYRLRIGTYRALFVVKDHTILVEHILHRKDAY